MAFSLEGVLRLDARQFVSGAKKAEKAVDEIGDEFGKLPAEAKKGTKGASDEIGKLESSGDKAGLLSGGKMGASLIKGFAASGAVAAIGALLQEGFEQEATLNSLQAQFRLSEEEAAAAGKIAGNLYRDNWGESLAELSQNVAHMSRELGDVSEAELERVTTKVQAVSDTWGIEFAELTRSASQMVENGLVASYDEALDVIVSGFQDGANEAGDFLETIDEYSQHFAAMGLSGGDALAIIQHGLQNGQRDSDKLADAVKEMRIRVVENTDAIASAYERLGLDQDELQAKFSAGGSQARDAYVQVLRAIESVEDPVERQAIAVELIGTQYEDLGPKALDSLLAMTDATIDLNGRSEELVQTIDATEWEKFERTASDAFGRLGGELATFANDGLNWLAELDDATKANQESLAQYDAAERALREFDQTMLDGLDTWADVNEAALAHFDTISGGEAAMWAANEVTLAWNETRKAEIAAAREAAEREAWLARTRGQIVETTEDATEATGDLTDETDELAEKTAELVEQQRDYIDSLRDVADSSKSLERKTVDLAREIDDANTAFDDGELAGDDLRDMQRRMTDQTVSLADAAVRLAEDTANANGKQISATESLRLWNEAAIGQAATMRGELRTELVNYIAQVNGIPEERVTEIEALLDQGKVAEAQARLDELSAARRTALYVDANTAAAKQQIDSFIYSQTGRVISLTGRVTGVLPTQAPRSARGTPYHTGGVTVVGEYGPELVDLPRGSRVYDAATSRAMMSQPIPFTPSAGSSTTTSTINRTVDISFAGASFYGTPPDRWAMSLADQIATIREGMS